jgi:hypothetical protein
VGDEHVAHSGVSIIAGAGLTGGGTIAASRTLNVIGGTGITVTADAVSTNDSEIDHGALNGIGDDDHTIYSLVDGTRSFTGKVTVASADNVLLQLTSSDAFVHLMLEDSGSTGGSYLQVQSDDLSIFVDGTEVIRWDEDGSGLNVASSNCVLDEDAMGSDDPKRLATQQSIKAYADLHIKHTLADAANDFLVASGADVFVKKTLAETGAILEGDINHDNLQGFAADEHIDWTIDDAQDIHADNIPDGGDATA